MFEPRVRFDRGFHDATADVMKGRANKLDDTSRKPFPNWESGYRAGWAEMTRRVEAANKRRYPIYVRPKSSDEAWAAHVASEAVTA